MSEPKWTKGSWDLEARGGEELTGVEAEIAEMQECEAYALREISVVAPDKPTSGKRYNKETKEWDIPVPTTISQIVFDPRDGNSEEQEANAHLIAASPDLYSVLDAITTALVDQEINFGPLIADAQDVLSKARGES